MEIPDSVKTAWFKHLSVVHAHRITGGFSSSRVWRLETPNQNYCLKSWPRLTAKTCRLNQIHQHLHLLSDANLEFVPRLVPDVLGSWLVEDENWLWEVTTWLAGQADNSVIVPRVRRESAIKAITKIHEIWRRNEVRRALSPGWNDRLKLLAKADSQRAFFSTILQPSVEKYFARQRIDETMPADSNSQRMLQELADRTISHLHRSSRRLIESLQELNQPQDLQFVIRDLHSEHVLYTGDLVTGVLDYGAARIDEPLLDLVRLLGSQAPFDRQARYETLELYLTLQVPDRISTTKCLSMSPLKRYSLLDEVSTLLSSIQWLDWLVVQHRSFPVPLQKILNRWCKLLDRLDCAQW